MKKVNNSKFIDRAVKVHGKKYGYKKVEYVNAKTKVIIECKAHGEFSQTPDRHLNQKSGCPKCGMERSNAHKNYGIKDFIDKANKIHSRKYVYPSKYVNSKTPIDIKCKIHGIFSQRPSDHLQGKGCSRCAVESRVEKLKYNSEDFIEKSKKVHGKTYEYSRVEYKDSKSKVIIVCKKHGKFKQKAYHHIQGSGCPKCGKEKAEESKLLGTELIRNRVIKSVEGRGLLVSKDINVMSDRVTLNCNVHGRFTMRVSNLLHGGKWCKKCSKNISKSESEVAEFIRTITPIITSDRSILENSELDIYIPSKKLAIEYNGLYWHSDKFKEDDYHLNKTKECNSKGVRLIHIFDDEWVLNKELVKSRLKSILGSVGRRIYARKCQIEEVSTTVATKFLDYNHIQGRAGSKVKLGLYYEGRLVSLMTFGKPRINMGGTKEEGTYELVRFCTDRDTIVVGGASRLLSNFIKLYNPNKVISYADLRWSEGNVYEALNFKKVHESRPNYFYTKGTHRENRFKFRKQKLVQSGFSKESTEKQIMKDRGYYRIYDCGTIKYELTAL